MLGNQFVMKVECHLLVNDSFTYFPYHAVQGGSNFNLSLWSNSSLVIIQMKAIEQYLTEFTVLLFVSPV